MVSRKCRCCDAKLLSACSNSTWAMLVCYADLRSVFRWLPLLAAVLDKQLHAQLRNVLT
jgi:hypothetical protein